MTFWLLSQLIPSAWNPAPPRHHGCTCGYLTDIIQKALICGFKTSLCSRVSRRRKKKKKKGENMPWNITEQELSSWKSFYKVFNAVTVLFSWGWEFSDTYQQEKRGFRRGKESKEKKRGSLSYLQLSFVGKQLQPYSIYDPECTLIYL